MIGIKGGVITLECFVNFIGAFINMVETNITFTVIINLI